MRVAERWFEHRTIDEGIVLITEPNVDPFLRANLFLVRGRDRDMLVDAGLGLASLREELADVFEGPVVAVATHRHFDHTGGLHEFEEVLVHRDDADAVASSEGFASLRIDEYPPEELSGYEPPPSLLTALPRAGFELASYAVTPVTPTRIVADRDSLDLRGRRFGGPHLPGHTPGEVGLVEGDRPTLVSGDCVYESGFLFDELPESDVPAYVRSMERLRDVPVGV